LRAAADAPPVPLVLVAEVEVDAGEVARRRGKRDLDDAIGRSRIERGEGRGRAIAGHAAAFRPHLSGPDLPREPALRRRAKPSAHGPLEGVDGDGQTVLGGEGARGIDDADRRCRGLRAVSVEPWIERGVGAAVADPDQCCLRKRAHRAAGHEMVAAAGAEGGREQVLVILRDGCAVAHLAARRDRGQA
jgi:hypothetical protein